jgi:excisionase family DNA binding protein
MPRGRDGDFYTVAEAADELGISPSTVWRWIQSEKLPAYRVGPKAIRIKKTDLASAVRPAGPSRKEVSAIDQSMTIVRTDIKPLTKAEIQRGLAALAEAKALRQALLRRRKGKPLPSSWQIIRRAREERSRDL